MLACSFHIYIATSLKGLCICKKMKTVYVTGAPSYLGTSVKDWE